jgi:serine/threonine protein kinase
MEGRFSPDFERWCRVRDPIEKRHSDRIVNLVGVQCSLESFVLDLSIFEETSDASLTNPRSEIGKPVSVKQYSRLSDRLPIVVKSFDIFSCEKVNKILSKLLMFTLLKHPCIAPLIGFVLPTESTPLKIATLYYSCGSLQNVQSSNPAWWTPTSKAKAIAGIALGMESVHQLETFHGSLKPNNIIFDENHYVHIVDFGSTYFKSMMDGNDITYENRNATEEQFGQIDDLFSFAFIVFDILVGRDAVSSSWSFEEAQKQRRRGDFPTIPEFVPEFVREMIQDGMSQTRSLKNSFRMFVETMKRNDFKFAEGVDVGEVKEFVNSIES